LELSKNYRELELNLLIKQEKLNYLSQIDSLVLDIDGVIVDVTASFRVAIRQTVQYYFTNILKWPGKVNLISPAEIQLFKLAGGFNNDWELTFIVILFYLAKSERLNSQNLDHLKRQGESLEEFTSRLKWLGGGFVRGEELVLKGLGEEQKARINRLWKCDLARQIFQEYYAGEDFCERLYGFKPTFIHQKGLINQEKILLDAQLVKPFYPKIGILTGRTRKEAELALERAGLSEMVKPEHLLCDEWPVAEAFRLPKPIPRKPDPEVLVFLSKVMGTRKGIYIGDTVDDLETVNNFQKLALPIDFISCIVLHRPEEQDFYLGKGVDILTRDVNQVLKYIKGG